MCQKKYTHTLKTIVFYLFLWLTVSGNGTGGGSGCGCASGATAPTEHNISLSTQSLNFGETSVGMFSIQPLTMTNPNYYDVMIQNLTVTNDVFRVGEYYINGRLTSIELPFTLKGSDEKTLYIEFYTQELGEYTGVLTIDSIDISEQEPEVQTDNVSLKGVGVL